MALLLLSIGGIFAVCAVVAGVDELIHRWANRRAVKRRAERYRLRREARSAYEEATQYEPTFASIRSPW